MPEGDEGPEAGRLVCLVTVGLTDLGMRDTVGGAAGTAAGLAADRRVVRGAGLGPLAAGGGMGVATLSVDIRVSAAAGAAAAPGVGSAGGGGISAGWRMGLASIGARALRGALSGAAAGCTAGPGLPTTSISTSSGAESEVGGDGR